MHSTRTEQARVDAFVAAIRASAHPNRRPARLDPPTVELPAVVAYASTRPEPRDVPLVDRLRWWAITALLLALLVPFVAALAVVSAPRVPAGPGSTVLPSFSSERVNEGPHGGIR